METLVSHERKRYTNDMNKPIIYLLSIFLLLMQACAHKELAINLNSENYVGKDKIVFQVCNGKSDEPLIFVGVDVEKRIEGKWFNIESGFECQCHAICDFTSHYQLQKGQCEAYSIDLSELDCDEKKPNGEYRFSILVFYNQENSDYSGSFVTFSESFLVK